MKANIDSYVVASGVNTNAVTSDPAAVLRAADILSVLFWLQNEALGHPEDWRVSLFTIQQAIENLGAESFELRVQSLQLLDPSPERDYALFVIETYGNNWYLVATCMDLIAGMIDKMLQDSGFDFAQYGGRRT